MHPSPSPGGGGSAASFCELPGWGDAASPHPARRFAARRPPLQGGKPSAGSLPAPRVEFAGASCHHPDMDPAALFLSAAGRLGPRPFAIGAVLIYAASLASQTLISAPVVARAGFWPFAAAQATPLWVWYALHAKRPRDAGQDVGAAAAIAALYALAMVLLLFVAFFIRLGARPSEE